MQGRPQQSAPGKLQKAPKGRHGPPPHAPLMQGLSQHGAFAAHIAPSGWHITPPHWPLAHTPSQQSTPDVQEAPTGKHVAGPQTPLVQLVQQGMPPSKQGVPSPWHCVPHTPLVQMLEQHGRSSGPHVMPSGVHAFPPHMPLGPQELQHGVLLQGVPSGVQTGLGPHTPPLQMPSQHWEAALQLTPSAKHEGAPPVPPPAPLPVDPETPRSLRPHLATAKGTPSTVKSTTNSQE